MKSDTKPHVRLTPDQVRALFDLGHLRPTGYLYLLLASLKHHGWKHRVENVNDFCLKWGISRSAFYRSKAKLISDGLITEDIIGAVDLSTHEVHSPSVPESGTPVPESGTPVPESGTPVPESGTPVPESGTPVPELRQTQPEDLENTSFQGFSNSSSTSFTEFKSALYSTHSQTRTREENFEEGVRAQTPTKNFGVEEEYGPTQESEPVKPLTSESQTQCSAASPRPVENSRRLSNLEKTPGQWWGRWRTGSGPNQWNEGFIDWMTVNWIHGQKRDRPAIIGYLANCEADRTGAALQKLEAYYDAYEQSWQAKTGGTSDDLWKGMSQGFQTLRKMKENNHVAA